MNITHLQHSIQTQVSGSPTGKIAAQKPTGPVPLQAAPTDNPAGITLISTEVLTSQQATVLHTPTSATQLTQPLTTFLTARSRQIPPGLLFDQVYTFRRGGGDYTQVTGEGSKSEKILKRAKAIKSELLSQPDLAKATSLAEFQTMLASIAKAFPKVKNLLMFSGPSFPEPGKGLSQQQLWLNQVLTEWQSESFAASPRSEWEGNRQFGELPNPTSDQPVLPDFAVHTASSQGPRSTMEDAHQVTTLDIKGTKVSYFGLFDGHGGSDTANACAEGLHETIAINLRALPNLDDDAMVSEAINKAFTEFAGSLHTEDGATGLVSLRIGNRLFTASLGDSRAIIKRDNGDVEQLSYDQKPSQPQEIARVIEEGGFVSHPPSGPVRVGGVLAVSRAFGDAGLTGISNTPFISVTTLKPGDSLILGCDGVWDVTGNHDAASVLAKSNPAEALVATALNRDSQDNVSVITARFSPGFTELQQSALPEAQKRPLLLAELNRNQQKGINPFTPPKGVGFAGKFFGSIGLALISLTGIGLFASIPGFIALFRRPATPHETNLRTLYNETRKLRANIDRSTKGLATLSPAGIRELNENQIQLQQNTAQLRLGLPNPGRFVPLRDNLRAALGANAPENPNPFYLLGIDPAETGTESPEIQKYIDAHSAPPDDMVKTYQEARKLIGSPSSLERMAVIAELRGELIDAGVTSEDVGALRG